MARPDGGWISGYTAPAKYASVGVWSLRDAFVSQRLSTWPVSTANSTQLLLHFNGDNNSTTFTDSGVAARTVTRVGSPVISTSASKFGGASGSFPGSGSYLTVADADSIELSNKDFAIEFWMTTTNSTQYSTLISRSPSSFATGMWSLLMNFSSSTAGDLYFYAADYSTSSAVVNSNAVNLRDGEWHHVAISRNGNTWAMYTDGTQRMTRTSSATVANIAGDINIGRDQFYGRPFGGNIDELRILIGTAGQWTTASVTLPTAEY